jgi:uncharacterized protein (TIGR03084 family)
MTVLQQATDLRDECDALYDFVATLDGDVWQRATPFKGWTVWDVIAHLHYFNWAALQSLISDEAFLSSAVVLGEAFEHGLDLPTFTREHLGPLPPAELLEQWRSCFVEMCERMGDADPERRLKWYGPDMGVRMFATARQMETWAHGQDVYDLLRVEREHADRLKNVVVLGIKTFGWTFANRGLEVPATVPYVRLRAPSGALWEWGEPSPEEYVEGTAVDFCRVVTQNRNVADTGLSVTGATAKRWMAIAQCFAGGPAEPPAPGERAWDSPSSSL